MTRTIFCRTLRVCAKNEKGRRRTVSPGACKPQQPQPPSQPQPQLPLPPKPKMRISRMIHHQPLPKAQMPEELLQDIKKPPRIPESAAHPVRSFHVMQEAAIGACRASGCI